MKVLWIVGGSGAALEVWAVHAALLARDATLPLAGFVNLQANVNFDPDGLKVMPEASFLREMDPEDNLVALAVGSPSIRARAAQLYEAAGFSFLTLIHPQAVIGPRVTLGTGSIVMAGAVLETDIRIGPQALINVQSSIAHECIVGSACSLGPGVHLAGQVTLGDRCDIGVGAVIRPGVALGADIIVGAGAAVVSDFEGPALLVGVPARRRSLHA